MTDAEANEVKRVLWKYRDARERLIMAWQRLETARAALTGVTIDYSKDRVQTSPVSYDKTGEMVDEIAKMEAEHLQAAREYLAIMDEVEGLIDGVKDARLHELLCRRYILRQGFEQIAYEMSYDYRHIRRLHKKALALVWEEIGGSKNKMR